MKNKDIKIKRTTGNDNNEEEYTEEEIVDYLPDAYSIRTTITNRYHALVDKCGQDMELESKDYYELSGILFDLEQLDLAVRKQMLALYSKREFTDIRSPAPLSKTEVWKNLNGVRVEYKNEVLKITAPVTLLRYAEESWFLSQMLEAAIKAYNAEHEKKIKMRRPAYLVIRRRANRWNHLYRDNENFETSKLINELCGLLGMTDRADIVMYTSLFEYTDEEPGTVIYMFPADTLKDNWELMGIKDGTDRH